VYHTPYDFDAQRIVLHNRGSCNLPDDGVYTKITKSVYLEAGTYYGAASVIQTTSLKPICQGVFGYGQTGFKITGVADDELYQTSLGNYCDDITETYRLEFDFDVSVSDMIDITLFVFSSSCADTLSYVDDILVSEVIEPSAAPSNVPSSLPSVSSLPSQSPSNPPSSRPSVLKKRKSPVKECLGLAMLHAKCGCKETEGHACFHRVNTKRCLKDFKKKNRRSTRKQEESFQQKTQKAYERECETQKGQGLLGASADCFTC
jgi:hypothetical protein